MSKSTLKQVIKKISNSDALAEFIYEEGMVLLKGVAPHGFRHNFNNRISEGIDEWNQKAKEDGKFDEIIDEKKELDSRKALNGHKGNSSGEECILRHTKKKSEKLMRPLNEEIDQQINEGVERAKRSSD